MLNDAQIKRMLEKLRQLETTLEPYIFAKVSAMDMQAYKTTDELFAPPDTGYEPAQKGYCWGGERSYCWFKGSYTVPAELAGEPLYLMPDLGGYEILLFVNKVPFGTFAYKICATGHGNHYCDLISLSPKAGEKIDIDLEAYAGTFVPGCFPFQEPNNSNFDYIYNEVSVCRKNQDIADFIFDLHTLTSLAEGADQYSFRRGDIINCLTEVHKAVIYSPEHSPEELWRPALAKARELMADCLAKHNSASAAECGLIGHSHMDTAWLWDVSQTIKKCARTYSNQISLMEQYPEYTFVQSSAYHLEMIRRHYPQLFEKIKEKIAEGRYEPNGAVWVECDCNITSGESMVRQFLWGQRYTKKHFGFTSDCFWLPDTFGYSAAIPQIMKGCGVDYFLTTKLSWNDTNTFPYETFVWEGLDGTKVFVHFNTTHNFPDPKTLIDRTEGRGAINSLQQKSVSNKRLISYGFGDGGGGPQFEMIEYARRVKDLEGCPKAEHTTVSKFMHKLEESAVNPNVYSGELYLELHRGTLTNQHTIKRNNRKAEQALHNAELATVANAVAAGNTADGKQIDPLTEVLLENQFHDILPGTCIQSAHETAEKKVAGVIADAEKITCSSLLGSGLYATNTSSFTYDDIITLPNCQKPVAGDGVLSQEYTDLYGNPQVDVYGIEIKPFASSPITFGGEFAKACPFSYQGNRLVTPFAEIVFNEKGYIYSYKDLQNGRELVKDMPLNTFLFAEDVPNEWDNWDIDSDLQMKLCDSAVLESEEVVSQGGVELRIRRKYRLTDKTTVAQDMVFYAHTPRIDFFTLMSWYDKRHFLKAAFDTTILARTARHEIQFGCANKPTTRNNSVEQAMFEVVNHKYTDISEPSYGCALLNDSKYGISVEGGKMSLSLHKSGIRPDPRGDNGEHYCVYSFLPHNSGYCADSVIKPAYLLNYKPIIAEGRMAIDCLLTSDKANIVIETIKPCEDRQKAFIARIYEAEGSFTSGKLTVAFTPAKAEECNLLEEAVAPIAANSEIPIALKPFEIKTIKLYY